MCYYCLQAASTDICLLQIIRLQQLQTGRKIYLS